MRLDSDSEEFFIPKPIQFWYSQDVQDALNAVDFRYYIYALLDTRKPGIFEYPISGTGVSNDTVKLEFEPFYIGKGCKERLTAHFKSKYHKSDNNKFKQRVIAKILEETGEKPKAVKLITGLSSLWAFDLEERLITTIGRRDTNKGPLTNLSNGGPSHSGVSPCNKGVPFTLEQSLKISLANKGKKQTDEQRKKFLEAVCKNTYKVVSPEGEEFTTNNLNQFSKDHGLKEGLSKVVSGKVTNYKDWKVFPIEIKSKIKYKGCYKLIFLGGREHTTNNLNKFSEEFNLDRSILSKVIDGKYKQHMGWTVTKLDCKDHSLLTNFYTLHINIVCQYLLKDPSGDIHRTENLKSFCRDNVLNYSSMCGVCSGASPESKGWTGSKIRLS